MKNISIGMIACALFAGLLLMFLGVEISYEKLKNIPLILLNLYLNLASAVIGYTFGYTIELIFKKPINSAKFIIALVLSSIVGTISDVGAVRFTPYRIFLVVLSTIATLLQVIMLVVLEKKEVELKNCSDAERRIIAKKSKGFYACYFLTIILWVVSMMLAYFEFVV